MCQEASKQWTRRDLLRAASAGAAATGLGALDPAAWGAAATDQKPEKPRLPAGMLGKTGHPTTLVSFGAMFISEQQGTRVLRAGIDAGINTVHCSASYVRGKAIQAMGELFKAAPEYRRKVFLCLKSFHPDQESELTGMLKTLNTDHADLLLSTVDGPDATRIELIQKSQDKLKAKGLIRHTGFVCHSSMNEVIELVLDKAPDYFDATLLSCAQVPAPGAKGGAKDKGERFLANLKKLRAKRVGILSMKSGARDASKKGVEAFQPHAKMLLEAGVDTVLTSIDTFEQVETAKKAQLSRPLTPAEKHAAASFRQGRAGACLMCADCARACPNGVPVNDLMRIRMYHDEYGWADHAGCEFAALGDGLAELVGRCGWCTACAAVCPVRLAGAEQVRRVAGLFAPSAVNGVLAS